MVDRVRLGSSELMVSPVGIGTWQAGMQSWGSNYTKKDIIDAIVKSVENGVNFLDTAEVYGDGLSETIVGEALKQVKDEAIVATKVKGSNLRYDKVLKAADSSLKRLGIKTIDLYQIHWPNFFVNINQTIKALELLVKQGKIRYIGVSNFPVSMLKKAEAALSTEKIVSNQIRYNIIQNIAEKKINPYCKKRNISVIAWSPLAKGVLTDKYYEKKFEVYKARTDDNLVTQRNLTELEPLFKVLSEIGSKYNKTISQISLNWIISKGNIAIPGAKNDKQAILNAGAMNWRLGEEDIKKIDSISSNLKLKKKVSYRTLDRFYQRGKID
jgi:aryl-alcohol dehydrogenase-like predicted oxidoreductase